MERNYQTLVVQFPAGTPYWNTRIFHRLYCNRVWSVRLRGLSIRERAKALINIAHPDFREELEKAAKNLFHL
jgi:hypothetical protein